MFIPKLLETGKIKSGRWSNGQTMGLDKALAGRSEPPPDELLQVWHIQLFSQSKDTRLGTVMNNIDIFICYKLIRQSKGKNIEIYNENMF